MRGVIKIKIAATTKADTTNSIKPLWFYVWLTNYSIIASLTANIGKQLESPKVQSLEFEAEITEPIKWVLKRI